MKTSRKKKEKKKERTLCRKLPMVEMLINPTQQTKHT